MKIYLETNKYLILTSAKFHVICCTETVFFERVLLLYGHTSYLQNHMVTIFFEFTKPTAKFYITAYHFYSDCEASALSFNKMHTVFACLHIYYLSTNMYMFVKGSLKKKKQQQKDSTRI